MKNAVTQGLRLTEGCDLGPHPDDIIEHQGTDLGDVLLALYLDARVRIAMAQVERARSRSIWRWLL